MSVKPIYFPALSAATTNYMVKDDSWWREYGLLKDDISPRFYSKPEPGYKNAFYHPYTLWSAAHHYKIKDLRKKEHIDKGSLIFIDSGGYQLATGVVSEKKYNNKIALEWSEANGDLFPILDRPLTPGCSVDENLDASLASAKFYAENRTRSDTSILNVMSARNVGEMEHWFKKISQVELDGWAHGGHQGNMKTIVKGVIFFLNQPYIHKRSEKSYYHIFGTSTIEAMIYFATIQKCLNKLNVPMQLTYDSSSFQRSAAFGTYFMTPSHEGMKSITFSNRFNYDKIPEDYRLPCDCPMCSNAVDMKRYFKEPMDFYIITAFHNLYMMLRAKNIMDNIIYTDVEGFLKGCFNAEIRRNILAIEEAIMNPRNGLEIIDRKANFKEEFVTKADLSSFFS